MQQSKQVSDCEVVAGLLSLLPTAPGLSVDPIEATCSTEADLDPSKAVGANESTSDCAPATASCSNRAKERQLLSEACYIQFELFCILRETCN